MSSVAYCVRCEAIIERKDNHQGTEICKTCALEELEVLRCIDGYVPVRSDLPEQQALLTKANQYLKNKIEALEAQERGETP